MNPSSEGADSVHQLRYTVIYSQNIDDAVHTLPEYTHRALWRPK